MIASITPTFDTDTSEMSFVLNLDGFTLTVESPLGFCESEDASVQIPMTADQLADLAHTLITFATKED